MAKLRTTQIEVSDKVIDLGIGQPTPSLLPVDLLRQAAEHRLGLGETGYLGYGAEEGYGGFREALAGFLGRRYGQAVNPEQLMTTAGASHTLDLICTLFTKPGDTIFAEEPSYFLALRIFADHGLNVVGLPMDDQGLQIEALEAALKQHTPAFLYTIPTYHNPSGITLSAERREQVVAAAQAHNFTIIADEVYHLLNYDGAPPPPLATHAESGVVLSMGSFSKILAPGLRLGWLQTSPELMARFTGCGILDSGGGLNPFTSAVVRSAIELGLQETHLAQLKTVYGRRMRAMETAITAKFQERGQFAPAGGGFFIWLKVNRDIDSRDLLAAARDNGVAFVPGARFSCQDGLQQWFRLSCAYYDSAGLEKGIERLSEVVFPV